MTGLPASQRFGDKHPRMVFDPVLIAAVSGILLLGLIMVTSASVELGARDGNSLYFMQRQLGFAFAGIIGALFVMQVPTALIERLGFVWLLVGLLLLVAVLIPGLGVSVNGSRRWLRMVFFSFQASELARICLLFYLCSYLVRREAEIRTTVMGFLKPLAMLLIAALLLLIEPDYGSGVVLMATALALVFLSGQKVVHFLIMMLAFVALGALALVAAPYRLRRLTAFQHAWDDPFGSGFQLVQSEIAIGRGDWLGVGLGSSIQKLFYLPEAHTDFVFAVLAEELGFLGIFVLICLVLLVAYRSLAIARMAIDSGMKFPAYIAASFGIWLCMQAFINMAVNMGVMPTKGLTLPLLSYGRSSLLVTLAWIGVVLRVYHEVATSRAVVMRGGLR